jgi:uncharacterized membrane protein YkvA (DUF1232 family)
MAHATTREAPAVELAARPRRGKLMSLPIISDIGALIRFFRDPESSLAGKLFIVLSVAYIVFPLDFIPDLAPVLGWLDDMGVAALALAYVLKATRRYKDEGSDAQPAQVISSRDV